MHLVAVQRTVGKGNDWGGKLAKLMLFSIQDLPADTFTPLHISKREAFDVGNVALILMAGGVELRSHHGTVDFQGSHSAETLSQEAAPTP